MDPTALRCRWVSVLQLQCAGGIKVIKRYPLEHIPMLGFRDPPDFMLHLGRKGHPLESLDEPHFSQVGIAMSDHVSPQVDGACYARLAGTRPAVR